MLVKNIRSGLVAWLALGCLAAGLARAEGKPPAVVAVFLMESRGSPLSADELVGLTDYLAARLGEGGRFSIIPREELRKRLATAKVESHQDTFDSSSQIDLARELAAQYSIVSAISKVGSVCLITASVWDLARATQIKAATEKSVCKPEALIDAVDGIAVKLGATMTDNADRPKASQPPPVVAAPAAAAADGPRSKYLGLASGSVPASSEIQLRWNGLPGNSGDWISVASAGMAEDTYVTYLYTGGKPVGTFAFGGLDPGDYEARVYLDWPKGGYRIADRLAFSVVSDRPVQAAPVTQPAGPATTRSKHLGLAKASFSAGEPVEVFWYQTSGSRYDWVAVVPRGTADDDAGSHYDYLNGKKDGSFVASDLEPGEYEVRIYLDYSNLGYVVADRLRFVVR
jgi:hypothetical protein